MLSSKAIISTAAVAGLAAVSLWAPPGFAQQSAQPPARPPITIDCPNGHRYRLTTGSDGGVCKTYVDRGKVVGGFCTDGTNSALQTCSTGCGEMTGSGACDKHDPSAPAEPPSGGA